MSFSITKENDPHELYRVFQINLNSLEDYKIFDPKISTDDIVELYKYGVRGNYIRDMKTYYPEATIDDLINEMDKLDVNNHKNHPSV